MTTQEKISEIIMEQYNGFNGRYMKSLKRFHELIRNLDGDEKYLKFLEERKKENPKPIFTPNPSITKKQGR